MNDNRFPSDLDGLFAAYRDSFDGLDGSRNFMPDLWAKIEQRQRVTYGFRRMASGFVTAAAAICLMLSALLWTPSQLSPSSTGSTYVDVLVEDGTGPEFETAGLR
jgi:hypothetical protein